MQARTKLFETQLTFDGLRDVPKPLCPFFSGLEERKVIRRAPLTIPLREFKGPEAYKWLWLLPARAYRALARSAPPITSRDALEVNRLANSLKPRETLP